MVLPIDRRKKRAKLRIRMPKTGKTGAAVISERRPLSLLLATLNGSGMIYDSLPISLPFEAHGTHRLFLESYICTFYDKPNKAARIKTHKPPRK